MAETSAMPVLCRSCGMPILGTRLWIEDRPYHPECASTTDDGTKLTIATMRAENEALRAEAVQFYRTVTSEITRLTAEIEALRAEATRLRGELARVEAETVQVGWAYQDKRWDADRWHVCGMNEKPREFDGRTVTPIYIRALEPRHV